MTFWGVLELIPFVSSSSAVIASGDVAVKTRRFLKLNPFDEDSEIEGLVGEVVDEEEEPKNGEDCGLEDKDDRELELDIEIGIGDDTDDTEPGSSLELSKAEGQSLRGEGDTGGGETGRLSGEGRVSGEIGIISGEVGTVSEETGDGLVLTKSKIQGRTCSFFSCANALNRLMSASRLRMLTFSTLSSPSLCNWASVLNNFS